MDIYKFLSPYIAYKSISADPSCQMEMKRARYYLLEFFHRLRFKAREVEGGGHPAVFAQNAYQPGKPTILLYGHYDVQPADELNEWQTPPFKAIEKDGRIWGRGTSDNKGCHATFLCALDHLVQRRASLPNIKILLDGEEEIGSPSMPAILKQIDSSADLCFICDTSSISQDKIVITTGLRGTVSLEIQLTGQKSDLHSGMGGCILNPLQALVDLCSQLHTPDGRINIPHFYDNVLPPEPWEQEELRRAGLSNEFIAQELGTSHLIFPFPSYSAADIIRFFPTLEFNGIQGGYQGEGVKTIIPRTASAKISCRIVPNQDPKVITELIEKHIRTLCPKSMHLDITFGRCVAPYFANPYKNTSNLTTASFQSAQNIITKVFGNAPYCIRDGATIAMADLLKNITHTDVMMVGWILPEDRIHASNESASLSFLKKGRLFFEEFLKNFH